MCPAVGLLFFLLASDVTPEFTDVGRLAQPFRAARAPGGRPEGLRYPRRASMCITRAAQPFRAVRAPGGRPEGLRYPRRASATHTNERIRAAWVQQRTTEGEQRTTIEQVKAAIDKLGSIDFPVRTEASRTVRRTARAVAVPLLIDAVTRHTDGYVRFRALVLLSAFNDPRTRDVMLRAMTDPNDRLRAVAYTWFEHNPDPAVLPKLLAALDHEDSEFVRPALTRALVAHGADPKVRDTVTALVMKGQDFFRAGVIEAVGEYRAAYALQQIVSVAKLEGPLQDDAVVAIGRIGDKRGLETLVALQRTAPRTVQPSIAAAICLLGVNCGSHQGYLVETLRFAMGNPGFQELLRATAQGLAALAVAGRDEAALVLFDRGAPARDPERAAIVLAVGTIGLRNTPLVLRVFEQQADPAPSIELLREAFDMFEEDFEEERFFAAVRRAYWQAPESSAARKTAESLIRGLEF